MRLHVRRCGLANEEHEESRRQYAHVFHKAGTICVADAFFDLPEKTQLALLLHEVGHRMAGIRAREATANKVVREASGIHIHYRDGRHGERLEWIAPGNKQRAREFLGV